MHPKAVFAETVTPRASQNTIDLFRENRIILPTFRELANPHEISLAIRNQLREVDSSSAHALNLFRVHWYNAADGRAVVEVPDHVELPEALTGVKARIVVVLANRFPLIRTHKVLAAYACLAPRIVAGRFDPTIHRPIWPSTGNYCRGGIAISKIMACHGVAILPEGMSDERFQWLKQWVSSSADIIRTPGSESNVKAIFDKCAELAKNPEIVVLNQFSEYGNYLAHYQCTGSALERVFESVKAHDPRVKAKAFVSASGSAGTLAAGDYLKERYGVRIVAAEALECPTLLNNGFGNHNIQGIGDKHVPLIHNVMNTDIVTAVSDRATDLLNVVFNTSVGRSYLVARRGVAEAIVRQLPSFGLSSICNLLASIKVARYLDLSETDVVLTVATDGADMYESERAKTLARYFSAGFDATNAGEICGQYLNGASTDHLLELNEQEKTRIFNLGYYTWVEQQMVSEDAFEARRQQTFWRDLRNLLPIWDEMIVDFNRRTGLA